LSLGLASVEHSQTLRTSLRVAARPSWEARRGTETNYTNTSVLNVGSIVTGCIFTRDAPSVFFNDDLNDLHGNFSEELI
jgi:hypothetical protein